MSPGASPADWHHWQALGLTADLLPVISDLTVPFDPRSSIKRADGKTPSTIDGTGKAWGMAGWPTRTATANEASMWAADPRYSIGLVGRQLKAIDIDIDDPQLAGAIRDAIEITLGAMPCRSRPNTGRCLLLFRMSEPMAKTRIKVADDAIVEFLGERQQFLLNGTHKSGVRYEWLDGLPTSIPVLTPDDVAGVIEAITSAFGVEDAAASRDTYTPRDPIACNGTHIERDRVVAMWEGLHGERADGRIEGLCPWTAEHSEGGAEFAMYIPAAHKGQGHSGYRCLHAHCDGRTVFDFLQAIGVTAVAVRDSFDVVALDAAQEAKGAIVQARNAAKAAKQMTPVVMETQRERAVRIGREGDCAPLPTQRVMTGSQMIEELVLLEEGTRVSRVSNPRYVLAFEEFRKSTAGSVEITKNDAGRKLKVHRAQLWLESRDRKTVRTQTFAPGREALCMSPDNVPAQNLWVPRSTVPPANWRDLSAPFFEHVAYLVPEPGERDRFLDWVAHIEQAPGTLPSTHYLMVARQTGIGRNWLAYALARAFAGHTALGFDLSAALKSGFNGSLSMKLLAVVDELHEGGPGGAHTPAAEKLKSMLTEATRLINPKHGRQHTEFNCSRFLMFSNHAAALPLADNDRRVIVIENPGTRRSEAHFTALYALLDDPAFGPALAGALKHRDISAFNPGAPAPMTEAKARTIRAGRSEVEQAVRDVANDWPAACITSSRLVHAIGETLGGKTWSTQSACVAAGLVKYPGRVKVAGVASHVWVLRDQRAWAVAPPADVAAEVLRGQEASEKAAFA